jgi:putative transposase
MERRTGPSDLTDAQWAVLRPLIPPAELGGRTRTVAVREVLNRITDLLRTGCAWRFLPHDLPPWGTVHYYFWRWQQDGTWEAIHTTLRTQVRRSVGKEDSPSTAILDSQSVKTTEKGGHAATMPARR